MRKILLLITVLCTLAATAQQATSPNELFKIAFTFYQQGQYEEAIRYFNNAIKADPYRNYFYYNRALCYKALKMYDKALEDFRQSNVYKQTAEAYYQAGLILYEKNDLNGAKAEFEMAKMIREDLERMNFLLGMIYFKENRYEEASQALRDYTERVKNNADAYYYRGLSEAKLGRYQEAITNLKFAMMYKKNDWQLYYKMYEIYLAMNDKTNALYSLTMVIELGEKKPEFYEERARLYLDTDNTFKYEEDTQTAKELRASMATAKKG